MKTLLTIILASTFSLSAFATTTLNCKSANYAVEVADIEEFSFSSYSINGRQINGADVELENSYISDRVVALSISVDGQPKHIELAAAKDKNGVLKGTLFFGKVSQSATCKRK